MAAMSPTMTAGNPELKQSQYSVKPISSDRELSKEERLAVATTLAMTAGTAELTQSQDSVNPVSSDGERKYPYFSVKTGLKLNTRKQVKLPYTGKT